MTTMVERVARLLAEKDGVHPDWTASGMGMPGPEDNEPGWKLYEDDAKAIIQAMREPTEAMVDAAFKNMDQNGYVKGNPASDYTAMIDAALNDEVMR